MSGIFTFSGALRLRIDYVDNEIDDGLGKMNNANEIQKAARNGNYQRLFELLGDMI